MELITSGTFDEASATANWLGTASADLTVVAGRLRVANGEAGAAAALTTTRQTLPTVVGDEYRFKISGFIGTSGGWQVSVGDEGGDTTYISQDFAGDGSIDERFTATTTLAAVTLVTGSATVNEYSEFDNVSLEHIIAAGGGSTGAEPLRPRGQRFVRYTRRRMLKDKLAPNTRMLQGPTLDEPEKTKEKTVRQPRQKSSLRTVAPAAGMLRPPIWIRYWSRDRNGWHV